MEEDKYMHISKDAVFLLIKEIKELRKMMPDRTNSAVLLKRHDLKVEGLLLERLLSENGNLNKFFEHVRAQNARIGMMSTIQQEEDDDGQEDRGFPDG